MPRPPANVRFWWQSRHGGFMSICCVIGLLVTFNRALTKLRYFSAGAGHCSSTRHRWPARAMPDSRIKHGARRVDTVAGVQQALDALIVFRPLSKVSIHKLNMNGARVPPGVSAHRAQAASLPNTANVAQRTIAFRLLYDLSILTQAASTKTRAK